MMPPSAVEPGFRTAIVRTPCPRMVAGLTTAGLGPPDYRTALAQHGAYIAALEDCGLEAVVLPADDRYPDSTFVEDTALLTPRCAVLTNPGAASRKGEVAGIRPAVAEHFDAIETIKAPGTLDAGDVMRVGSDYYIGLSARTNLAGAEQLTGILRRHGLRGIPVTVGDGLHLKSGLSYIENGHLLITGPFLGEGAFRPFKQLVVDEDEAYAANSLWVNGRVLVPRGFPKTLAMIAAAGYETIVVDTSEFRKIDGGLSCLSLRF